MADRIKTNKKRKRDSAFLTWNSKAKSASRPGKVALEPHELVIPNPFDPIKGKPLPPLPFPPPLPAPSVKDKNPENRLIWGDNLHAIGALINRGYEGKVDLIYIDPPFASNAPYSHRLKIEGVEIERIAYNDTWPGGIDEYLDMLHPRLELMKRLLSAGGKIFVHCDWRVNSYIRVLLDEVFGRDCFLNEIVWNYGGRGAKATSGQFPRNHDTIFAYGRTEGVRLKKVYSERLLSLKEALKEGYREGGEGGKGGVFKTAPRGDYTDKSVAELERQGRIHRTSSGNVRIKYFLQPSGRRFVEKKLVGDVWDDIPDAMHSPAAERTAFTTQKPEALIQRIIEAATEKGELVCDFFSGSGTTGVVAEKLGRRWIICEQRRTGIQVARGRLLKNARKPFLIEKVKTPGRKEAPCPPSPSTNRLELLKPSIKKIPGERGGKGGRVLVTVTLGGYTPGGLPEDFRSTKRAAKKSAVAYRVLMDAAGKDFTLLIDNWAVDWDYDGRVFKSRWQSLRGNGKGGKGGKGGGGAGGGGGGGTVEKEAQAVVDKGFKKIAVRVVDIFGCETQKVIEV